MSIRVLSYILGSIIGTGVLTLPSLTLGVNLTDVLLSLGICTSVFSILGFVFSKTSNPFGDIDFVFSLKFSNAISVMYWCFSWVSTMLIVYEISNELLNVIGINPITAFSLAICQILVVVFFIIIQRFGLQYVNKLEIFITCIKILFVTFIPFILIYYGIKRGFVINWSLNFNSVLSMVPQMMWMYLGIESCSVLSNKENITKTVLNAVLIISIIYGINVIGVSFAMDNEVNLSSPYPFMIARIIGIYQSKVRSFISIMIIILCAGSLNSWYVVSAKTFQSLTKVFSNKYTSNYFYSVLFSSIGLIPLSILVSSPNVKIVFANLIDVFGFILSLFYCVASYAIAKKHSVKIGFMASFIFFVYAIYGIVSFII